MSSPTLEDSPPSLMHVIRALVRAPGEDINSSKSKKTQHPYYKRPGKGHNHDCCDACQEGGDLICCDRCPASFHLGCHDPPLEEADIPQGQWLCLECRSSGERLRPISPTSSHKSSEGEKKSRTLRANRSNSSVSSTSTSSRKNEKEKDITEKEIEKDSVEKSSSQAQEQPELIVDKPQEEEKELTPMEALIKAAKVMNPRQFQLPREMQIDCPFPGTDKPDTNGTRPSHMLDTWGCVPLPAKLCFHCLKSCRTAPLVQCDYCPLLFHQDCLDPPLTALPSGRWMCPNHVEQYIDWQLVNSISATERVALWEKFNGPLDHNAVRLDFIRCARRKNPPFRIRLPPTSGKRKAIIPEMVRYHYRHPPPLLPQLREFERCKMVLKSLNYDFSLEEKEAVNKKQIICLNLNCPKYMSLNDDCYQHEDELYDSDEATENAAKDMEEDATEDKKNQDSEDDPKPFLKIGPKKRKMRDNTEPQEIDKLQIKTIADKNIEKQDIEETDILNIAGINTKEAGEILFSVDEHLKKLDARLVKLLAFQRLQQLLIIDNGEILNDSISELIVKNIDKKSLARYGFNHVALPSELLSQDDLERIAKDVAGAVAPREEVLRLRRPPTNNISTVPANIVPMEPMSSLSALPVRATLCPIERPGRNGLGDGLGRPVPMRLTQLTIGLGSSDLSLRQYGSCSLVSDKHAIIFYDEITRHFELINYSEFGTCVNGQLYSCDFTELKSVPAEATGAEERAVALRNIASKRRGPASEGSEIMPTLQSGPPCACSQNGVSKRELVAGWEGSAILTHGSLLQFGCIMFVFSITDSPNKYLK